MIRTIVSIAVTVAFAACVDAPELAGSEQGIMSCGDPDVYNCKCTGCGANGLDQGGWNALFAEADRNGLNAHGAWSWGSDGPMSLCNPGSVTSGSCVMRDAWHNWIAGGGAKRVGMMTNFVKVIAAKTYAVRDPYGYTYYGEFGLSPASLGSSWSYADQEIVIGGMLALLNAEHGVPVCLKTERSPGNCVGGDAGTHESTMFGNTFRPHYAAISGGRDVRLPAYNGRYGNVDQGSATAFNWGDARCAYSGTGADILATSCVDQNGTVWNWPVTVMLPVNPTGWYYLPPGTSSTGRPAGTPIVY